MKDYQPYRAPFKHGFAFVGAHEVLDIIKGRIFNLERHMEDRANGKETGDSETVTAGRIAELYAIIDTAETMEKVTTAAKQAAFNAELENNVAPGRAAIAEQYDVDDLGTIRSPGKFEGEPLYSVYFWEVLLNGDGTPTYDESGNEWTVISINDEERAEFPELRNARNIALTVNNEGFIFTVEDTDPAFKHLNEDNAPADEDEQPAGLQHENGTL